MFCSPSKIRPMDAVKMVIFEFTMNVQQVEPVEFLNQTAKLREADPIGTNLIGSIAVAAAKASNQTTRFWVISNPQPIAFALISPIGMILSPSMDTNEAEILGERIGSAKLDSLIPQATGSPDAILAFSKSYRRLIPNAVFTLKHSLLVYVLDQLKMPLNIPGALRLATSTLDTEVLVEWSKIFFEYIGDTASNPTTFVHTSLAQEGIYVWEVNGYPVGFLRYSAPVELGNKTIYKIGPVFVPETERRKGYGKAMTAALCELLLNRTTCTHCEIMLNADADNIASNKAYQSIGFQLQTTSSTYGITYTS